MKTDAQDGPLRAVLSPDMAAAYEFLLAHAPQKASGVAKALSIQRPIAYLLLEKLIEKNLVSKQKILGKPAVYIPQHPLNLQAALDAEVRNITRQKSVFEQTLPSLISAFHMRFGGIPGFRVFVGKEGVLELYEDILNEKKELLLIRSLKDKDHPETQDLVRPQIRAQVEAGISVRAISPYDRAIPKEVEEFDTKNRLTRRIVSPETFKNPAQIMIYADKVGIISFGDILVTTIIEDALIKETFVSIFEYLWKSAAEEDRMFRSYIAQNH